MSEPKCECGARRINLCVKWPDCTASALADVALESVLYEALFTDDDDIDTLRANLCAIADICRQALGRPGQAP